LARTGEAGTRDEGARGAAVESPATVDDAIFLLGLVGVPLLVGAVLGYLRGPWRWAAVAAVAVFLLLVILPAPEEEKVVWKAATSCSCSSPPSSSLLSPGSAHSWDGGSRGGESLRPKKRLAP
jgi:MFS family permease